MRIMGLDFGSKTVGVAVCDPLGITAQMVETIFREKESKLRRTLARIEELVREYEIEAIVLGYPKNMNNSLGFASERSLEFKKILEEYFSLPVHLVDERLSTVEAEKILLLSDKSRKKRKKVIDNVASSLILDTFLKGRKKENE